MQKKPVPERLHIRGKQDWVRYPCDNLPYPNTSKSSNDALLFEAFRNKFRCFEYVRQSFVLDRIVSSSDFSRPIRKPDRHRDHPFHLQA